MHLNYLCSSSNTLGILHFLISEKANIFQNNQPALNAAIWLLDFHVNIFFSRTLSKREHLKGAAFMSTLLDHTGINHKY